MTYNNFECEVFLFLLRFISAPGSNAGFLTFNINWKRSNLMYNLIAYFEVMG